ncbi:MAG: hypothetical protein K0R65_380 [Crocinitomicaceae bacterium]|jgi:hypothetical protein|nr:hypothetical protein [Crocinitomicaceae bacterium]
MKFTLLFILLLSFGSYAQQYKPFSGKLIYQVDFTDSVSKKSAPTSFMTVYTNDTLVRLETESGRMGKQSTIRHLVLNKYYILLEVNGEKYAIQHQAEADTSASKYTFDKKWGKKRFDGKKAKKVQVNATGFTEPLTMYYFKDISPKYIEAIKGVPGLPVEYYIQTEDGMFRYKLVEFSEETTDRDLFGIPSDYQKVTFDEFMNKMMQGK